MFFHKSARPWPASNNGGLLAASRWEANKPTAKSKNDDHQRKNPVVSSDLSDPKMKIQCVLKRKATATIHAANLRKDCDPRRTIHAEHRKSRVVITLTVARTIWCTV
jgi:hypothetical protein